MRYWRWKIALINELSLNSDPWLKKREELLCLEKWNRVYNLRVANTFAEAFNKGSFLVIPSFRFRKVKWAINSKNIYLEEYSSPIHNPFDLKYNVLFPRIEMRSYGDFVPLWKVNFIKVFRLWHSTDHLVDRKPIEQTGIIQRPIYHI